MLNNNINIFVVVVFILGDHLNQEVLDQTGLPTMSPSGCPLPRSSAVSAVVGLCKTDQPTVLMISCFLFLSTLTATLIAFQFCFTAP